jgi:hypothetical protein
MSYTALIDGDILAYEMGQSQMGSFVPLSMAKSNCDKKVQDIVDSAGCEDYQIYLTDSPNNFRLTLATIKPYKGNRDDNGKPPYWADIRLHLVERHGAVVVSGYETDDKLAMEQSEDTVICSRDKDLDQVEGWHYSWTCGRQKERPIYFITESEGLRNFYTQMLIGDTGDNIPGLFGVGPTTANKKLAGLETELELYSAVQKMYEDRFGSYWELFLTENARLLYLLRSEEDVWKIPG